MLILTGLPLYYQNPIGRLYEHPDGYIVVDYNAGKRVMSDYRAFLTHLEGALKRNSWNKMLTNQRFMAPFSEEERTWIVEQWLAVSHALQREMIAAVLLPEDVIARLGVNTMMQGARQGALVYRVFNEAQAAAAWLRQVA